MKVFAVVVTVLLLALISITSLAQKKVVVLGSSTAEGTGASPVDSSWVARLQASFRKNTSDGIDTVVDNRAKGGYTTYHSMPTGNSVPNRPAPDPDRNVTYVLNDIPRANVVIINYPSNDITNGFSAKEMMDNLRAMVEILNANNITTYITTTQPRTWLSDEQRTTQRQLVDSIRLNFGLYAINFWDDLVTGDGSNTIRSEVSAGDGIHINNLGHRLVFERVQAKNILSTIAQSPLPVALKSWNANLNNAVVKFNWSTTQEESDTYFEIQRSKDGRDFQTVYRRAGYGSYGNYSWEDLSPFNGKNFYRLRITEAGKTIYSRIIPIMNDAKQLVTSLYTDASQLYLLLNFKDGVELAIINLSGSIVKKQSIKHNGPNNTIKIPISELASGNYYLRITTSNGSSAIERFVRVK